MAIHFDLSKMFHTVRTGKPKKFMRLMVWRNGKTEDTWQSYGWKVVAFGDQPSSCVLEISKELTALTGEDIDKVAARSPRILMSTMVQRVEMKKQLTGYLVRY